MINLVLPQMDNIIHIEMFIQISDQSASLWGNCCFEKGDVKITMGTGSFLNINTGATCLASVHGLYPLVGYKMASYDSSELVYLMEGASNDNGSIIEWAMSIGLFTDPRDSADMALSVPNSDGVSFIPAFSGLGVCDLVLYFQGTFLNILIYSHRYVTTQLALGS